MISLPMEVIPVQPIKILVAAALISALLGGCGANSAPPAGDAPPTAQAAVETTDATASSAPVAPTPTTVTAPTKPSPTASSAGVRGAAPGVGEPVAMYATDPATVDLAAGELQFVKFFAFW